jgi:hypothetical protein
LELDLLTNVTPVTAVFVVIIALAVNGPDYDAVANGGSGYWGEPTNQPLEMRLGPNPGASMNAQFESVLNVAFAYAGNQAFITVMCEMKNPYVLTIYFQATSPTYPPN